MLRNCSANIELYALLMLFVDALSFVFKPARVFLVLVLEIFTIL